MREQQIHPPLSAALPMILETHECDGKGSLEGSRPISCSGRDSDLRDVLEHPGMCPDPQEH